jgi:hypothetical protein
LHADQPTRRLASALSLAFALAALALTLIAPSQTIARSLTGSDTRASACSASRARTAGVVHVHACIQSAHKRRRSTHRQAKSHARRGHTKKHTHAKAPVKPAPVPASCEDGSAPVREAGGSFTCRDGSEPECEDGATPAPSRTGTKLLCPATSEGSPESGEGGCEEGADGGCDGEPPEGASERECAGSASEGSSFACDGES